MIDDKFLGSKNSICYSTTLCVMFPFTYNFMSENF